MPSHHHVLLDAVADIVGDEDAGGLIAAGEVLVDGMPVRTPRSRLRPGATVTLRRAPALRGSVK
ncbi:MAG: hypothetical protein M3R48_06015, partial [Candidatus Dormibacteraeota bacterium]|nr:hypothetical protein [Candidatus Dormibacteraeota bacterium]